MIKRAKYYDIIKYEQEAGVAEFLKDKKYKKTLQEELYLMSIWKSSFESAYFSYSWWRKIIFTCPNIVELVKKYDKLEMEFNNSSDWDEFFCAMEKLLDLFETNLKEVFAGLRLRNLYLYNYYDVFSVWNYIADEARQLIFIIIDSDTSVWNHFAIKFAKILSKLRPLIGFKVYEKLARSFVKAKEVNTKLLSAFVEWFINNLSELKINYQIKIFKIFWSQISKFDKTHQKIIEAIFR